MLKSNARFSCLDFISVFLPHLDFAISLRFVGTYLAKPMQGDYPFIFIRLDNYMLSMLKYLKSA